MCSEAGDTRSFLGVLLHETRWPDGLEAALAPLCPVVLDLLTLPAGLHSPAGAPLLEWISRAHPERPLLGLTGCRLMESSGRPLRGLSLRGLGVAVVSDFGLDEGAVRGVVLHEVAHALGLDHCADPVCALSVRPWPLPIDDRGDALCASCKELWWRAVEISTCGSR